MRLSFCFIPNLFICIAIRSFFIGPVSADLLGLIDICTRFGPEGAAILESSPGGPEILAIFKINSLWLIRLDTFTQRILEPPKLEPQKLVKSPLQLIRPNNSLELASIFSGYPLGGVEKRKIVSFYGLKPDHPFYNNILVFFQTNDKQRLLLRYQVDSISVPESTNQTGKASLSARLKSHHRWDPWKNLEFIWALHTIRGSRLLLAEPPTRGPDWLMYVLNTGNLDHPIVYDLWRIYNSKPKFFEKEFYIYLSVPDKNGTGTLGLSFMKVGDHVCVNEKCVSLRRTFVECQKEIDSYSKSFAYWLYAETEMTMRLLIFALHAILACNLVMAIIFVSSQMNKMFLLI